MRIIGVDPGLIATGYGVIDVSEPCRLDCLAAGVIRPDTKDLSLRLLHIHEQLTKVLHEFIPDALAVEDLYASYEFPKTAILMGHARGVIILAARRKNIPIMSLSATKIKKSVTGSGHAGKLQVQRAVFSFFRVNPISTEIPSDVTDALAIAVCCNEYLHSFDKKTLFSK
jgi:crossover junction endodeoxyribonuclease RuvC